MMVPCERSCHKEYTCAIFKPYHLLWPQIMAKVKVFFKVGQTSRSRSRGIKYGSV